MEKPAALGLSSGSRTGTGHSQVLSAEHVGKATARERPDLRSSPHGAAGPRALEVCRLGRILDMMLGLAGSRMVFGKGALLPRAARGIKTQPSKTGGSRGAGVNEEDVVGHHARLLPLIESSPHLPGPRGKTRQRRASSTARQAGSSARQARFGSGRS